MKKTELLELPIYDTPDVDIFDLEDWNVANQNLENTIASIVGGNNVVDIVNQEVVEARKGKATLLEKINEMDSKDEENANALSLANQSIEGNKTEIGSIKTDISNVKNKVTELEDLKNTGGEINGELTVGTSIIIKDDTQSESRIKLKSSSGNLRVVKYNTSTPQIEDEMFSVTYGKDGGAKTFNLGDSLKATNGYTYLPNGFILQWGTVTLPASTGTNTFSLPITFPNANLNAQVSILDNGNVSSSSACRLLNFGVSSIQIANSLSVSMKATYFCIGY